MQGRHGRACHTPRSARHDSGMDAGNTNWKDHGIKVVRAGELDSNTPQTPGMSRAAAITYARTGATKLWAGTVVVQPNAKTGPHHHGELETVLTSQRAALECAGAIISSSAMKQTQVISLNSKCPASRRMVRMARGGGTNGCTYIVLSAALHERQLHSPELRPTSSSARGLEDRPGARRKIQGRMRSARGPNQGNKTAQQSSCSLHVYRKFSASMRSAFTASNSENRSDRPSGETERPQAGSCGMLAMVCLVPSPKLKNWTEAGRELGMK